VVRVSSARISSGSDRPAGWGIIAAMRSWAMAWVLAAAACEAEGRAAPVRSPESARESVESEPPVEPTTERSEASAAPRTLVTRTLRDTSLALALDPDGTGQLLLVRDGSDPAPIPCDRLTGAWGLWIDDIDDDGRAEAIVALHKPARFDPAPHNRLHVYGFEDGRCVPAWRGTRLSGRFDAVATDPDDRGALLVHEWLSPARRRVARYRWGGFGYAVERVLWEGRGEPPAALAAALDFGPSPHPIASDSMIPATPATPTGDP
jgi:hypothetical protein